MDGAVSFCGTADVYFGGTAAVSSCGTAAVSFDGTAAVGIAVSFCRDRERERVDFL